MHKSKFNKHNDLLNQLIEEAKDKNLTGGEMGHAIIELYKHDNMLGGSFWSDLVGVISDVLPFIAPMLNVVPIIGPALSMSAYSLAPAGKIGTELYRQKEEDDYGLPSLSGIAKNAIKRVKNIGKDVIEYIEDKDKNIIGLKPSKSGDNVYKPTKEAPSIREPAQKPKPSPIDKSKPAGLGKRSKKGTKAMKDKMAHLRSLKKSGGKSRISQAIQDIKDFKQPTKEDIINNIIDTTGSLITSGVTGYLDYKEKYGDKPKKNEPIQQNVSNRYEPYVSPLTFDSGSNDYNDYDNYYEPVEMKYPSIETSRRNSIVKPKYTKHNKETLTNKLKKYLDEKQIKLSESNKSRRNSKAQISFVPELVNLENDNNDVPNLIDLDKIVPQLITTPKKAIFYNDPEDQDPEYTIQPRAKPQRRKPYIRKGFDMLKDAIQRFSKSGLPAKEQYITMTEDEYNGLGNKRTRGRPRKVSTNNISSYDVISASGNKNKKNLTVSFND